MPFRDTRLLTGLAALTGLSMGLSGCQTAKHSAAQEGIRLVPYAHSLSSGSSIEQRIYDASLQAVMRRNAKERKYVVEELSVFSGETASNTFVMASSRAPSLQKDMADELERRYPDLNLPKQLEAIDVLSKIGRAEQAAQKLDQLLAARQEALLNNTELRAIFLHAYISVTDAGIAASDRCNKAASTALMRSIKEAGTLEDLLDTCARSLQQIGNDAHAKIYSDAVLEKLKQAPNSPSIAGAIAILEELGLTDKQLEPHRAVLKATAFTPAAMDGSLISLPTLISFCRMDDAETLAVCSTLAASGSKRAMMAISDFIEEAASSGNASLLSRLIGLVGIRKGEIADLDAFQQLSSYSGQESALRATIILGKDYQQSTAHSILKQPGLDELTYSAAFETLQPSRRITLAHQLKNSSQPKLAEAASWHLSEQEFDQRQTERFLSSFARGTATLEDVTEYTGSLVLEDEAAVLSETLEMQLVRKFLTGPLAPEQDHQFKLMRHLSILGKREDTKMIIYSAGEKLLKAERMTAADLLVNLSERGYRPAIDLCLREGLFIGNRGNMYGFDNASATIEHLLKVNDKATATQVANGVIDQLQIASEFPTSINFPLLHRVTDGKRISDLALICGRSGDFGSVDDRFIASLSGADRKLFMQVFLAWSNCLDRNKMMQATRTLRTLGETTAVRKLIEDDLRYSAHPEAFSVIEGLKFRDPRAFIELRKRLSLIDSESSSLREELNTAFRALNSQRVILDSLAALEPSLSEFDRRYAKAIRRCPDLRIQSPFRLSPASLVEAVSNRTTSAATDARPVAVMVSAVKDWNGALNIPARGTPAVFQQFRTYYFEVSSDVEAATAFKNASLMAGKKVSVAILNGHGNPSTLAFNEDDPARGVKADKDRAYLDFRDARLLRDTIAPFMAPHSSLVLLSCSVGGKQDAVEAAEDNKTKDFLEYGNLSRFVAKNVFGKNPGRTYGPLMPVQGDEVIITPHADGTVTVGPIGKIREYR